MTSAAPCKEQDRQVLGLLGSPSGTNTPTQVATHRPCGAKTKKETISVVHDQMLATPLAQQVMGRQQPGSGSEVPSRQQVQGHLQRQEEEPALPTGGGATERF